MLDDVDSDALWRRIEWRYALEQKRYRERYCVAVQRLGLPVLAEPVFSEWREPTNLNGVIPL